MTFRNPILGAGGSTLLRPAIQSPNFVHNVSGWTINRNGSAELNNLTLRGTFMGQDSIVNSQGAFFYNGTPAAGNLVGSWASAAGTDAYGNAYPQGLSVGNGTTRQIVLNYNGTDAGIYFSANDGNGHTAGTLVEAIFNGGLANEYLSLQAIGPSVTGATDLVRLELNSQNKDGSSNANVLFSDDGFGTLATLDKTALTVAVPVKTAGTWQAASGLGTGWAIGPSGGTVQPLQYRLDAEDNLVLIGAVHSTSTTPASTIFTLPAGYRPKITQRSAGVSNSAGTATARYAEVNSSGAVSINANIATASTDVYFECTMPLGNIA